MKQRFFTQEESYLMMDCNVTELVARSRIRLGWDRHTALTKPIHKRKISDKELLNNLQHQNQVLKEILDFYADKKNYDWDTDEDLGDYVHRVDHDQGKIARSVLEGIQ